ncbi:MAG: hypothetical protein PHQ66_01600 [Candidatus Nanoarchaeia archaeon]|nr:hypothetical protein [Candidatus Nanoarchaeia archaeon]MDD5357929.1 hypothetical protein [Candidatus Nanoarchaeia archaeon]MDD5588848.1 hypothetical protein [Candidatus Nanoarchaeia archaeon]
MGIQVEFNPDLALRKFGTLDRKLEECLPEELETGKEYNFLKKGQRIYYLRGEIPLVKTEGNQKLSDPLASIIITEYTHFIFGEEVWTKGLYKIIKKIEPNEIYFNGCEPIRKEEKFCED